METTIFGPPGTGKTTRLIEIVQQELDSGTRPESIAFVSFSRKAAEEARERAASKLNMDVEQMVGDRAPFSEHELAVVAATARPRLRGDQTRALDDHGRLLLHLAQELQPLPRSVWPDVDDSPCDLPLGRLFLE